MVQFTEETVPLRVERRTRRYDSERGCYVYDISSKTRVPLTKRTLGVAEAFGLGIDGEREQVLYQGTVGGLKLIDNEIGAVLSEAKAMGVTTVLDVVRPYDGGWDGLQAAFDLIDVFHCNGYEAQVITGEKDPATACETLVRKSAGLVIITLGPNGLVAGGGETLLHVSVFPVDSVDPTGAGDAFCAGVIDSLLDHPDLLDDIRGLTVEEAKTMLLMGSAAGAACVTSTGATSAVTRENVDYLMNEQGDGVRSGRRLI